MTENPFMMKSTSGYNNEDHTLYIVLKAPIKRNTVAFKTRLQSKFIVGKLNNALRILEIKSSRSYYQCTMFGKIWYSANRRDISEPTKTPIIWQRSKRKCLRALETANNTMIFEKFHFKEIIN